MSTKQRPEDRLVMPAGQYEAESLEARVLKEAEDLYNDIFGPMDEPTKLLSRPKTVASRDKARDILRGQE